MEQLRDLHGDGVRPSECSNRYFWLSIAVSLEDEKLLTDWEGRACLLPDLCGSVSSVLSHPLLHHHIPFSSFHCAAPSVLGIYLPNPVACALPPVLKITLSFSLFFCDVWVMPVLMLSSFSFSVSLLVENMVTRVTVKNATCTISTQSTTGNLQAHSKVDSIRGSDCTHLSHIPGSNATWMIHHGEPQVTTTSIHGQKKYGDSDHGRRVIYATAVWHQTQ